MHDVSSNEHKCTDLLLLKIMSTVLFFFTGIQGEYVLLNILMYLLSCPFHLPVVRASCQRLLTYDLSPEDKAFSVLWVILIFCTESGLAISIRQADVTISTVAVHCGLKVN